MQLLPPESNNSFFTTEELDQFIALAKKRCGRDLARDEAFDQFHRLYRLIDDIAKGTRNGTIEA